MRDGREFLHSELCSALECLRPGHLRRAADYLAVLLEASADALYEGPVESDLLPRAHAATSQDRNSWAACSRRDGLSIELSMTSWSMAGVKSSSRPATYSSQCASL